MATKLTPEIKGRFEKLWLDTSVTIARRPQSAGVRKWTYRHAVNYQASAGRFARQKQAAAPVLNAVTSLPVPGPGTGYAA